jgi:hypothetical protein
MKDIKGYEGLYAVTSCGKVWSYISKKFLKPYYSHNGYLKVTLMKDGVRKQPFVARLVLETYNPVENMDELQCNHIDECKEHNYLQNLNWMTASENINYGHRNEKAGKALSKPVICIETGEIYDSIRAAATDIGLKNSSSLSTHLLGRNQTCKGLHFKYADLERLALLDAELSTREELVEELTAMSRVLASDENLVIG